MADIILEAVPRTEAGSRPAGRLRRQGKVPAVLYGLDSETVAVAVPARELSHILHSETGLNTLITLKLDGEDHLTLARQIQRHSTRGEFLHIDFIKIRRDVAVSAEIPLRLTGEAAGVRDGGLLEQLVFALTIEAKPADIPVSIDIDVSELVIGDQLHLSTIALPPRVTTQLEGDTLIAQVVAPRVEAEPEVAELAEGEAPAEGEEGAPAEGEGEGEGGGGSEGGGE